MIQANRKFGRLKAVSGPVVDVEFDIGSLPQIHNALRIEQDNFILITGVAQ